MLNGVSLRTIIIQVLGDRVIARFVVCRLLDRSKQLFVLHWSLYRVLIDFLGSMFCCQYMGFLSV